MFELLNLFPLGLFGILFWGIHQVPFNKDYLSITTSKYLKGWFALVIVLHHLSHWTHSGLLFRSFETVGYLAVAVFFFFSGFGCQKRYMTVPDYDFLFLGRRLPALFVPYFVAAVCFGTIQACCGVKLNWWLLFFPWRGEALLPHAWYIFAVAVFYLVFYGLMKYFKHNMRMIVLGVLVYSIVQIIFCTTYGYGHWWIISTSALPFGALCAWKEKWLTHLLKKSYVLVLWVVNIGLWFDVLAPYLNIHYYISDNINSITCLGGLLLFSAKFKIGNKVLSFLGNIYLGIYLVHSIFIWIRPMQHFRMQTSSEFLWCLTVLAGSILGGYALHQLCKKPLQTYQQKLKQQVYLLKTSAKMN